MYYLVYGYTDPMLVIENVVMMLTPWLCLGALLLVERVIRGRFKPKRSYFITALLVSFLFAAIPMGCGCIGGILEGAFKLSAAVSVFLLLLCYALERIKEWTEQG